VPISLTAIGTNNGKASTGLAITVPAGGVPQGALIVFCSTSLTNDVTAVSDTNNSGYTQAVSSGGPPRTQTYYFPNCAALVSTNTITPTYAAATTIAMSAFYATGIATVGPLDNTTGVATGSSTTPSATTGTLLISGELVVGVVAVNGRVNTAATRSGAKKVVTDSAKPSKIAVTRRQKKLLKRGIGERREFGISFCRRWVML